MDDGGADKLRENVQCWLAGLNGVFPSCLNKYYKEFKKTDNPRYQEYLKLKKEFGE